MTVTASQQQDEQELSGFGERLRTAREARGQSAASIAEELRISPQYLEALENENVYVLPAAPYAIGFLRAYAQHLGLDSESLVMQLKRHYGLHHELKTLDQAMPASRLYPGRALLFTTAALTLLAAGGWWYWQQQKPALSPSVDIAPQQGTIDAASGVMEVADDALPLVEERPDTNAGELVDTPVAQQEDAVGEPVAEPAEGTRQATPVTSDAPVAAVPEKAPAPATVEKPAVPNLDAPLVLQSSASSWVEIRQANGRSVYQNMMKAGDTYTLPAIPGLRLKLGNAGVMTLRRGEQVSGILGAPGRVARVQLDQPTVNRLLPSKP